MTAVIARTDMSAFEYNNVSVINYPAALLRLADREGIAGGALLKDTDVSKEDLEASDGFVSFELYKQMIVNAYQYLKRPSLGVQLGAELGVTTHGMLGFAALSCRTYEDAIKLTERYFIIRFPVMNCQLIKTESFQAMELNESIPVGEVRQFLIESIFSSLKVVSNDLLGDSSSELVFEFDFPEPEYSEYYRRVFGNNVSFGQPKNRIIANNALLQTSLNKAEPFSYKLAKNMCEDLLTHIPGCLSVAEKIRKILRGMVTDLLQVGTPSLNAVADLLNMSTRTLRRRLQGENTSFHEIINDERKQLAMTYLSAVSYTHLTLPTKA